MKPKLIPRLNNWAYIENPSILTAVGYTVLPDGSVKLDKFNTKQRNQLSNNLNTIGNTALVAPTLSNDAALLYNALRHPINNIRQLFPKNYNIIKDSKELLNTFIKRAKSKGYNINDVLQNNVFKNAKDAFKYEFKREPIDGNIFDDIELLNYETKAIQNGGAYANRDKNFIFISEPVLKKNGFTIEEVLPHELLHLLSVPKTKIPNNTFKIDELNPKLKQYYVNNNNTELSARGGLVKDYFGITDKTELTPNQLKYAKENYIKDTKINNDMDRFFNGIIDFNKMTKWINDNAINFIPIIITKNDNE